MLLKTTFLQNCQSNQGSLIQGQVRWPLSHPISPLSSLPLHVNSVNSLFQTRRSDLERETANRHTLEATLEQKDDLIRTLRGNGATSLRVNTAAK